MICTIGARFSFDMAARLLHQWSSEKTVSKPHPTVHFVSWYIVEMEMGFKVALLKKVMDHNNDNS